MFCRITKAIEGQTAPITPWIRIHTNCEFVYTQQCHPLIRALSPELCRTVRNPKPSADIKQREGGSGGLAANAPRWRRSDAT